MSIATYSPALTLLFVCCLLWILMDIHFKELTPIQRWLFPLLFVLLAAFNHILRLQIGYSTYGKAMLVTLHLPVFFLFLWLKRCGVVKMVFMILTALVFTAPTVVIGNMVRRLFPEVSWALLLVNVITYVLVLAVVWLVFRKGFNYLLKYGDTKSFLLFSLVPFFYYLYAFAIQGVDQSSFTTVSGYIVRLLPTVQTFLFYFLLLFNYRSLSERRQMETAQTALRQKLNSAQEQITLLSEANTRTAVYQHDMRHHMNILSGFLAVNKPEQAEEYLKTVQSHVDELIPRRFCENETVNLLCSAFANRAQQAAINLRITADVPQELCISDADLCAVLSNGLENALNAASAAPEHQRWVALSCEVKHQKLLIEIKNPTQSEVVIKDGLPLSTREGHGYGCYSIRSIAERNRGLCTFAWNQGLFVMRLILPLHKSL